MMKLSIVIPCFVVQLYASVCCAHFDVSGSHGTVQSASRQELGLKRRVKSKSEVVQIEEAKPSKKSKAKSSKFKKSKSSKSSKSWEYPKGTKSSKSESKESKSSSSKVSIKSPSKSKRSKSATDSPSLSPSLPPTLAPVASTSASTEPLTMPCELSEEGIFGESSSTTLDVTYYYQMEHVIGADTDTIIADLERNVLNQIIVSSGLFEDCNEDGSVSINPDVIGLSISPDDESLSCTPDVMGCAIVKAQFTFYMTDERFRRLNQEEEPGYLTTVLEVIDTAFESDDLKSVSDDIIGLTYLGTEDPNDESESEDDEEIMTRSENGGGTDVPLIAVASSFGTLFLIAIAAGVRKQRRANISYEKNNEDNVLLKEVEDEETLKDGNTIGDNTLEGDNTVEGNNTIEGNDTIEGDGDHTIGSGEDHTFECEFAVDFDEEEEFEC